MQKGAESSGRNDYYGRALIGVGRDGQIFVTGLRRRRVFDSGQPGTNGGEEAGDNTANIEATDIGRTAVEASKQPNLEIAEDQPGEQQT